MSFRVAEGGRTVARVVGTTEDGRGMIRDTANDRDMYPIDEGYPTPLEVVGTTVRMLW